jgi:hypothetical protein
MTWDDFFGCDWDEYAQRISSYTTEKLCKQEINKTRQSIGASWAIGSGIGGAPFTLGGTLAISAIGSRRYRVATKKLQLIQAELQRRGVSLHEFDYKDFLIPVGAGLVGLGAGIGLEQIAIDATNIVPMGAQPGMPTGSSALRTVAANPENVIQGIVPGFQQQVSEMGFALNGVGQGIIPGSDLSQLNLAANTSWVACPNVESAIGFHTGMLVAQAVEKSIIALISGQCAWSLMEKMSAMDNSRMNHPCERIVGTPVKCDVCSLVMNFGTYWCKSHSLRYNVTCCKLNHLRRLQRMRG